MNICMKSIFFVCIIIASQGIMGAGEFKKIKCATDIGPFDKKCIVLQQTNLQSNTTQCWTGDIRKAYGTGKNNIRIEGYCFSGVNSKQIYVIFLHDRIIQNFGNAYTIKEASESEKTTANQNREKLKKIHEEKNSHK